MLTIVLLMLAQAPSAPLVFAQAGGGDPAIVSVTPGNAKPGERVKVEIRKPELVDIIGAPPDPRLAIARAQLRFYQLQARRAAIAEQIAQEETRIREEYERLVKALPGWKPGCDADEKQELVCPKEEGKK